jgi:F1F0 ATPase subunit 2
MSDTMYLVMAFLAGLGLGTFYFLNLWKTVQRISEPPGPGMFMFRNFFIRVAVVLPCFYLIMADHWERLVAAVIGFVIMREILVRYLGRNPSTS